MKNVVLFITWSPHDDIKFRWYEITERNMRSPKDALPRSVFTNEDQIFVREPSGKFSVMKDRDGDSNFDVLSSLDEVIDVVHRAMDGFAVNQQLCNFTHERGRI